MKVLIIGGGGREHALAWVLHGSPLVSRLYAIPGNPGIEEIGTCLPFEGNSGDLAGFALHEGIDLTVVGPEYHLSKGIVDSFEERGLRIFGPTSRAAMIETSKVFAKGLMRRKGIPTAGFEVFEDAARAREYLKGRTFPLVVKADGLAAGKGAMVCTKMEEAALAIHEMMEKGLFGEAGRRVVIEEFLTGREASYMVVTDGERFVPLPTSRDHKRLLDGDRGPNTGGMGAFSPSPDIDPSLEREIRERIIKPAIEGLGEEGRRFRGVLYAGLMIVRGEPFVLEFNARFGDPETQAVVMRLDGDILPVLMEVSEARLESTIRAGEGASFTLVLAQEGYPGNYEKGKVISGLDEISPEEAVIFHAGTQRGGDRLLTRGGRVLSVNTRAGDLPSARRRAYDVAERIVWEGRYFRRDIGKDVG